MKKINEIFYSIQGEGYYTGIPCIFIRFSGCNLKCHFCDTKHESGILMSDDEIVAEIKKYPAKHVVLTGGEPSLFVTQSFIDKLHAEKYFVQIETNGTNKLPDKINWVTVSPKEKGISLKKANEIKIVYKGQDVSCYEHFKADHFYLQPCSCENTQEVINYIMNNHKWKLSLQTHKILNIQ